MRLFGWGLLLLAVSACAPARPPARVGPAEPQRPDEPQRPEGPSSSEPTPVAGAAVVDESDLETRPPFDAHAARTALHAVDSGDCHPASPSAGYGHAQVTFAPNGVVLRVVIDAPGGLTDDVVACVGHELASATVPPFAGSDLTMGTGWHWR